MIPRVPLIFLELDFQNLYYIANGFYDRGAAEARFKAGVEMHHPDVSDYSSGSLLSLEEWVSPRTPTQPAKDVLLQVLQIMPFKLEAPFDRSSLVLHEMVVKTWFCQTDSFLGYWGKTRHCLTPAKPQKILMMLDRAMSHSVVHCHKKGHLGLCLSLEAMDQLASSSEQLHEKLQWLVDQGMTAITGLSIEEAIQNCKEHMKALNLRHSVFDDVDLCFARVGDEVDAPMLANTNMLLCSDLDVLFDRGDRDWIDIAE